MRSFAGALLREPRPLRGVTEGHVNAAPAHAEGAEEAARAGRGAVCRAPQRQGGAEADRLEARLPEHMHVRAPLDQGVEAVGDVRVVVARSEVDRERSEVRERPAHESGRVGRHALVLVEVAAAEQGAGVPVPRQCGDPAERVAERLPPAARRGPLGPGPREPRIEMEVGEVNDSHARNPGRRPEAPSAVAILCDPARRAARFIVDAVARSARLPCTVGAVAGAPPARLPVHRRRAAGGLDCRPPRCRARDRVNGIRRR